MLKCYLTHVSVTLCLGFHVKISFSFKRTLVVTRHEKEGLEWRYRGAINGHFIG